MLLTRSLPPPFLLPAWGPRKLKQFVQRAHKSDVKSSETASPTADSPSDGASTPSPSPPLPPPQSSCYSRPKTRKPIKPASAFSLFAELFPEQASPPSRPPPHSLPPFNWNVSSKRETPGVFCDYDALKLLKQHDPPKNGTRREARPKGWYEMVKMRRAAIVLKLSLASTILEESDFFRASPSTKHIAGWTGGVVKVIQGRDANTLEPQGHYFILFTHAAAATAYIHEAKRLHALARTTAGSIEASKLPPPPGLLRQNEELSKVLNSFSLVPGPVPLEIGHVAQPYTEAMVTMLSAGGHYFLSRLQINGEGTVLFSVDVGLIGLTELEEAIDQDGQRRNMFWRLVEQEAIVPMYRKPEMEADVKEVMDAEPGAHTTYRRPARYILSFVDQQEARRFVRDWHKRPFPRGRSHRRTAGEEAPPIVNAQIMW